MNELIRISDSTPVHEFPAKYNDNNTTLETAIQDLQNQINQKQEEINTLKSKFNSALNALRAEYLAILDPAETPNEDGNYILKARKVNNKIEYTWVKED